MLAPIVISSLSDDMAESIGFIGRPNRPQAALFGPETII